MPINTIIGQESREAKFQLSLHGSPTEALGDDEQAELARLTRHIHGFELQIRTISYNVTPARF